MAGAAAAPAAGEGGPTVAGVRVPAAGAGAAAGPGPAASTCGPGAPAGERQVGPGGGLGPGAGGGRGAEPAFSESLWSGCLWSAVTWVPCHLLRPPSGPRGGRQGRRKLLASGASSARNCVHSRPSPSGQAWCLRGATEKLPWTLISVLASLSVQTGMRRGLPLIFIHTKS